jgi:hypothetical protein
MPLKRLHFDGFEIDDMISSTQRLRALTDQSSGRLLTWIVVGNAAALTFCMSYLAGPNKIAKAVWTPLIASSWFFAVGLILGFVAAFCFTRAMSEYSLHSQEVMRGMRKGIATDDLGHLGLKHVAAGRVASVIVSYCSVLSATSFATGIVGALWAATITPLVP